MASTQNTAAWLPGVGKPLEVRPADTPVPDKGELLVEVKAAAVQPAEYKIQEGLLPFPLKYPTIIGLSFSGIVVKVGSTVTRFKIGDRVVTNSAGTIRNDSRFGAYQRYALTTQELTAKIGDQPFEIAASVSNLYGAASALFLHLQLDKPSEEPKSENKAEKILIWGASSSFGAYATQLAAEAGYTVVGVASAQNAELAQSFGAAHFVDRKSPGVSQELVALGPYNAVLAAADSAHDQVVIGSILAAQGGGSFLSTMGLRQGVTLPPGVSGHFSQFIDDYLDPKNGEFTKWLWWQYMENALQSRKLQLLPVRVVGGLSQVQAAWDLLKQGKVSGQRLVITPNLE
ncbi:chaperonin 10-like protein [Thelonectria olida]|uniref:Chaperonin 10-like protein n=1 Tax=Thelonectria olida TaxID=1576542 RepID=A0A9P9AH89_9HYPO|nr:chaperonin 10-like protein [Thelonectria olida]